MPVIQPRPFRHNIEDFPDRLIITLPSRRRWFGILFGAIWLVYAGLIGIAMSAIGLFSGITIVGGGLYRAYTTGQLDTNALFAFGGLGCFVLPFILFPFFMFTKGAHAYLWSLFGREIVEVSRHSLSLHFALFSFTRPREYAVEQIKDFTPAPVDRFNLDPWRTIFGSPEESLGIITFKYGKKLIRFGNDIEEAEARQILRWIQARFPNYDISL